MFRTRIREFRESSGFNSQASFAKAFGVAQSTVGGWEAGVREPNFDTLIRLAKFFNTTTDSLLGLCPPPPSDAPWTCDHIREIRLRCHDTIENVSRAVGISPAYLSDIESGKTSPDISTLVRLSAYFGYSIDYLLNQHWEIANTTTDLDGSQKILKKYYSLDAHGKSIVDSVLSEEFSRMQDISPPLDSVPSTKTIPLIGNSFAAGRGDPDFGNPWEDYEVPSDSKAEFAVRINGDSMEPYLHDGSIALGVKQTPRDGDVAALLINGEFLCKQVCEDNFGNLYLFALNRNRKDADQIIWNNSDSSVSCFGTIIMPHRIPLPRTV